MKKAVIRFDPHALYRLIERSRSFGVPEEESRQRVLLTIRTGNRSQKHRSKRHSTFYRYFEDNLSYFVICRRYKKNNQRLFIVKTVIIERGRP
ncbi:MAG: hypothetical protein V1743_05450 [Nanoarchaeota archaeon]